MWEQIEGHFKLNYRPKLRRHVREYLTPRKIQPSERKRYGKAGQNGRRRVGILGGISEAG